MNLENQLAALFFPAIGLLIVTVIKIFTYIRGGTRMESVIVPKTNTEPARKVYLQLMAMCSNTIVKSEDIEKAIKDLEDQAVGSEGQVKTELEAVAKYYRWVFNNINHIRSITQGA